MSGPITSVQSSVFVDTRKKVVQTFEGEAVHAPEREVVEPDESADTEASPAVVPRDVAEESAQKPAARVLDTEDAGAVERGAKRERTVSDPVVHRFEERLGEPVYRHVQ